jgi:hypothetical protein
MQGFMTQWLLLTTTPRCFRGAKDELISLRVCKKKKKVMTQWSPLLTVCRSFVLSEILNEYLVNGRYCERIMDLSSSLRPANYEPVTISQLGKELFRLRPRDGTVNSSW